jgi:hypothetical protein
LADTVTNLAKLHVSLLARAVWCCQNYVDGIGKTLCQSAGKDCGKWQEYAMNCFLSATDASFPHTRHRQGPHSSITPRTDSLALYRSLLPASEGSCKSACTYLKAHLPHGHLHTALCAPSPTPTSPRIAMSWPLTLCFGHTYFAPFSPLSIRCHPFHPSRMCG